MGNCCTEIAARVLAQTNMKVISRKASIDENGWRTTRIAVEGARRRPKSVYAVCVNSGDTNHLTLSKLYRIDITGEYATLTDNQGEVSVLPFKLFLTAPAFASYQNSDRCRS